MRDHLPREEAGQQEVASSSLWRFEIFLQFISSLFGSRGV